MSCYVYVCMRENDEDECDAQDHHMVRLCVCVYIYMYVYIYIHMSCYVYVCMRENDEDERDVQTTTWYVHVCVFMSCLVYVYAYTCIKHTYIHTDIHVITNTPERTFAQIHYSHIIRHADTHVPNHKVCRHARAKS
jgi:hypothetical protein